MRHRALILAGSVVAALWAQPGAAQIRVSASPAVAPDLGRVIMGSSSTTFRVSVQGGVTRVSGDAVRLSNAGVTTPTISIDCALLNLTNLCALRYMQVAVQPAGGSGAASLATLRVGSLTGASFRDGQPAEGSALTFVLNPVGLGTTTFKLGMDVRLAPGPTSGPLTFNYIVTASFL
jgi:hypothetical protein